MLKVCECNGAIWGHIRHLRLKNSGCIWQIYGYLSLGRTSLRYPGHSPLITVHLHCVSKNVPTLASCTFNKHGLISIIFGKQHQHTFKNDMHIQLSLSLHFYLLYLLLNSCDGNDAFWRHSVPVKSPALSAGNTGFYLSRSVSAKQSGWPGNPVDYRIWRLMQKCVYIVQDTCPRHQRLDAAHQWYMASSALQHWTASPTKESCHWQAGGENHQTWQLANPAWYP